MGREYFINQRAYHEDSGHTGIIRDVHLHVRAADREVPARRHQIE